MVVVFLCIKYTIKSQPTAPVERQEHHGLQGRAGGVVALAGPAAPTAPARGVEGRADLHLCVLFCLFCLEGGFWCGFHAAHEVSRHTRCEVMIGKQVRCDTDLAEEVVGGEAAAGVAVHVPA